ncbi:MAG: GreA/GreB family elongation factor [Pseudomonadota bacterium]
MSRIDKHRVLAQIQDQLAGRLDAAIQQQKSAQSGAFHDENKPEGSKDTRLIEASYLARGLAQRVAELQADLGVFSSLKPRDFDEGDPVALGALLSLEDEEGETVHYVLAPAEGGLVVEVDAKQFKVITPKSPLGRAVLGRRLGEDIVFDSPQGRKELCLVALS